MPARSNCSIVNPVNGKPSIISNCDAAKLNFMGSAPSKPGQASGRRESTVQHPCEGSWEGNIMKGQHPVTMDNLLQWRNMNRNHVTAGNAVKRLGEGQGSKTRRKRRDKASLCKESKLIDASSLSAAVFLHRILWEVAA